jgi:hypothetical protein
LPWAMAVQTWSIVWIVSAAGPPADSAVELIPNSLPKLLTVLYRAIPVRSCSIPAAGEGLMQVQRP